jgi:hypothetical protein
LLVDETFGPVENGSRILAKRGVRPMGPYIGSRMRMGTIAIARGSSSTSSLFFFFFVSLLGVADSPFWEPWLRDAAPPPARVTISGWASA